MPQEPNVREEAESLSVVDAAEKWGLLARQQAERQRTDKEASRQESGSDDATETDVATEDAETTDADTQAVDEATEDAQSTDETSEESAELTDEQFDHLVRSRKHRARSNGQDLDVTYDELLGGYSRTDDYTRKTQATAELRKQWEAGLAEQRARRTKLDEGLRDVEAALTAMSPAEPNWDEVRKTDPSGYPVLYADWQRQQDALRAIKARRSELAQEDAAERQTLLAQRIRDEQDKLLLALPDWKDNGKRSAEGSKIVTRALEYGFTQDEVDSTVDHRVILLLRDAMLYHELLAKQRDAKAKVNKTTPGTVRTAKPGSVVPRKPSKEYETAVGKLAKSGHVEDAAAALSLLRKLGPKQ